MAGEAVIWNPRRKKSRRKKSTARRKTSRRRGVRSNPIMFNKRRSSTRRRASSRRSGRRRVRRNPRTMRMGGFDLGGIAQVATGYVGARYGATWLLSVLPAAWRSDPKTQPLLRAAAKAVVGGIALPLVAGMIFKNKENLRRNLVLGAGVAVVADLFDTYAASMLPLPAGATLADYETGIIQALPQLSMGAYESGILQGDGAYGGGAY